MSRWWRSGMKRRRRGLGSVALGVALVLTANAALSGTAQATAGRIHAAPATPSEKTVPATHVAAAAAPKAAPFAKYSPTVDTKLPGAGTAELSLTTPKPAASAHATAGSTAVAAKPGAAVMVKAGALPVSVGLAASGTTANALAVGGTARVKVALTDQQTALAAGIHGILFSVGAQSAGSGPVDVSVDDSSFLAAYGGDYASRLHLVRLPACALTTPDLPACQVQQDLPALGGSPLAAQVALTGPAASADSARAPTSASAATSSGVVVLAATAGSGGSSGTYAATSLSPSGTWSSSGNTGAFDYSYPIEVPDAIGGAAPTVALSYDSSAQDGDTEGTNDQSSWVGDGWDTSDDFIERTYESCTDDSTSGAPANSGDECWDGQVLTLSLNGQSTQIAYDDTTKTFRAVSDSATEKIEDLTGATNGTYNGEYWRITENGVQYYFGLNRLPGWASGDQTTQSAWTVPVYGSHSGDPCHASTFAASSCLQGWQWNLDYVVDLNGNARAYYYQPETNYYGADNANTPVSYTRGGYLTRIDYGMTASTIYSATAPEQIVFNTAERCIAGTPSGNTCADSQFTVADAAYWPDVPIDQNCASTGSCTNHAPTFWTRRMLTSIVTQIQLAGKTQKVDEYDLAHSFPDGGDHAPTLWLDSIQRTGLDTSAGGSASVQTQPVSFDPPLQLANRVGTLPSIPVMYHDRIQNITTETGAQITVTYNPATCTPSNVPADPSTNTANCFPVYWTPYGATAPELDWFQKYTVKSVLTEDLHDPNPDGSYPELLTSYTYDGGAAWHYDDNQVVKAKNRTYGQFRGYAEVETRTGDPTQFHLTNGVKVFDQQTLTTTSYFRGMSSDTPSGTGGTTVTLTSNDGKYSATDSDALQGQVFETDSYTADTAVGGTIASATVTIQTVIGPTASQARTGLPALTAQMVEPAKSYTRTAVTGGWRDTETDTFYNTTLGQPTTGMPIQVDDRNDVSIPSQAQCTWTRYVENTAETLVLTAETVTSAQDCSSADASQTGQLVSDSRTLYDGHGFTWDGASPVGTVPTLGESTSVEDATGATGPATAGTFTVERTNTYDSYGRVLTTTRTPGSTDPNGSSLAQTMTNTYTPATGAPVTEEVTKTQVTTGSTPTYDTTATYYDPARDEAIKKIDITGLETDETYDALGRLTAVWEPNESKAAGAAPNLEYSYALSTTGPSVITSSTLQDDGSYSVAETLYDAMMRSRETQSTAESSTTVVSDTQYDSHGWTVSTNNSYNVAGVPTTTLVKASPVTIPDTTVTDYDGQGRADLTTDEHDGVQTSTSITAYAGDRSTVIPPTGGVTQTTYTNALNQTTETDQYTSAPTVSGTSATGYTVTGGITTATKYTYTPGGDQQTVTDPDGSVWTDTYDLQDQETKAVDPDTGTSTFTYDAAGNKVTATDGRNDTLDYTYDLLDRELTETDAATGFENASWLYDTLQVGQPTSSTRYVPGVTGGYTVATTGYTALGKPTGTKITLPASEAPLPTTYTTTVGYSVNAELETSQTDPKAAGLLGETIDYGYDSLDNPTTTQSTLWTYVGGQVYDDYGLIAKTTLGPSTNPAYETYAYDDQTKRLTDSQISRTQAPGPLVDDTSYTYDASGNPLTSTDLQEETGTTVTDTQCFNYNALDELTEAWTAAGACPAEGQDPTSASVAANPTAYWQSYAYDAAGDRTTETDHAVDGQTGDTTTSYKDGGATSCSATANQPHTLTQTTTTGPAGTSTTAFCSDAAGDTTSRTSTTGAAQSIAWNDEGDISSVTQGSSVTGYVYDANGNLLIRRDPTQTTLFAGDTEIVENTSVTPHVLAGGIRSYTDGPSGAQVAVRSTLPGGGVDYSFADPHGSSTMEMDVNTQALTRQELTPYGQERGGASATWVDQTRGFLNKPVDATTGYTDLGAREYDPTLGRFISADPLFESSDPEQLAGYTYSGDNPILHDDPSGRSWWGSITHVVNTVAQVAQVVAPVLNVVAVATAAVPGLDVITATAASIADTVNVVASVAQAAVNSINDIKDGNWDDLPGDIAGGVLAAAGGGEDGGGFGGDDTDPAAGEPPVAKPKTGTGATDVPDAEAPVPPSELQGVNPSTEEETPEGEELADDANKWNERMIVLAGDGTHTFSDTEGEMVMDGQRDGHNQTSLPGTQPVPASPPPTAAVVLSGVTDALFGIGVLFGTGAIWWKKRTAWKKSSPGRSSSSGSSSSSTSDMNTNAGGDQVGHGGGGHYILD